IHLCSSCFCKVIMFDLEEKVVLITGGARGIGFSCAKEILRTGARGISIVDVNETNGRAAVKELTEEFGPNRVIFVKTDVTKQDQLEEAFKETLSAWKTIDILINNAGIFNDKQYELEIAINATALVRGTLLGMQYMSKEKGGNGGVIVNMASTLGLHPSASHPIYAGTKSFIIGFSRSMGTPHHYNRSGIRVVTVCPSFTVTPLSDPSLSSDESFLSPDLRQLYIEQSINKIKQPPEIVASCVIHCIKEAETGSVWVAESNEHYQIIIPERKDLRK
ncbi:hypothetical protein ILUMI_24060, partial [Ignelater luminosus]